MKGKTIISALLSTGMLLSLVTVPSWAARPMEEAVTMSTTAERMAGSEADYQLYYQVKADGTAEITGITKDPSGPLLIPATIQGIPVTSIGKSAFSHCRGLTGELVIPRSVTSIGERAFDGCSGLTGVIIPAYVGEIGDSAFLFCHNMKSIQVSEQHPVHGSVIRVLF